MAMSPTNQNLIRDLTELLKTRGLRHAAHTGNTDSSGALISDSYSVYAHTSGNLAAPAAGVQRIVIDLTTADLVTMDEKGFGSIHPHVPSTSRQ